MEADILLKKQAIKNKINAKIAEIKQQQQLKKDLEQYSDFQSWSSEDIEYEQVPQSSPEKKVLSPYEIAEEDYQQAALKFSQYTSKCANRDGEYTHKLLFDFFKAQSIYINMEPDSDNGEIYQRFIDIYEEKSKVVQEQTKYQEVMPKNRTEKKMTIQEKLKEGKFCSFDFIPENNEIEEYKSHSSEQEILDQDCLEDLIYKSKKGKRDLEKQKNDRKKKKHESIDKRRGRKSKKQTSQPPYIDLAVKGRYLMNKRDFPIKITYPVHSNKRRIYKGYADEEDSENQVNYDSDESDFSQSTPSEQEDYSDDDQDECDLAFDRSEDFGNINIYEQIDYRRQQDIDLSSSKAKKSGKEKKIVGIEQYHCMNHAQKLKYFKKMSKEYQNQLKIAKQEKDKQKKTQKSKNKKKHVSFSGSISYKTFNANDKPSEVKTADEKKLTLVKAIWEYEDQ